ncbi:MAG: Dna2/Cas4 domain-containing protein, partial [Prevotella sp.]|nr:Dna2/Cas4 domain-containing protein [Prevotella sp.]
SNSTIQLIADYLMAEMPQVKILSDEAFRLDASMAVNVLVEAMRWLVEPQNGIVTAYLAKVYQKILGNSISDLELSEEMLPNALTQRQESLRSLPIYELAEQLHGIFELEKIGGEAAYLCAFYDQLSKFLTDNMADLEAFLKAWDENLHKKTIQGDGIDGIRLLTIHKSKGLEFDNVLLPFCDWKLEQSTLIWCQADDAPFNELPLIPIDYNANQMRGTVYADDYLHEHLQNTVDNMNLLYVAFTRARNNLFVIGRKALKGTRSQIIADSMEKTAEMLGKLPEKAALSLENDEKSILFEYGELTKYPSAERPSDNIFKRKSTPIEMQMTHAENRAEFRQSNQSRQFVEQQDGQPTYIQLGSILHELFSTIRTDDDIPEALRRFESEGILYNEEISRERLMTMLKKRLSDTRISDWFSNRWNIYNECSILYIDPESQQVKSKRPDRVMTDGKETIVVDFKFASQNENHKSQVAEYMELLTRMGLPDVKGYLWYVYNNQIVEVNGK